MLSQPQRELSEIGILLKYLKLDFNVISTTEKTEWNRNVTETRETEHAHVDRLQAQPQMMRKPSRRGFSRHHSKPWSCSSSWLAHRRAWTKPSHSWQSGRNRYSRSVSTVLPLGHGLVDSAGLLVVVWDIYTGMPIFRYFPFFPLFLVRSVLLFHLSLSELSVSFCFHFLWDSTHT